MRIMRLVAAVLLVGLGASGAARAEVDGPKRALILELVEISGGDAAARQIVDITLAHLAGVFDEMIDEIMRSETELSEEDKEALRRHLGDYDGFAQAFRARFEERVDMAEVLASVYVPLYDESFSTQELEEIVAFYRTPTGKKVVEVLPRLAAQGMERTLPMLQPKVMALVGEILAEQRAELFK